MAPGVMPTPIRSSWTTIAPTAATAKYKDSASVHFTGGNPWVTIGTWAAQPALTEGLLPTSSGLHAWVGLKNSDDQGTSFDLRAEVYKTDELVASGLIRCIAGITRNPSNAAEIAISLDSFTAATFDGATDVLRLRMLTRIGTNTDDTKCATGHGSAAGLRLYFDGINQASQFGATIP